MKILLVLTRIVLMLGWIFLCMPIQIIVCAFKLPQRRTFPVIFHTVLLSHILGMRVRIKGAVSPHHPTLFISNHISYLDILAIASTMPISFVSKAEVATWPLFGLLSTLQDTVFIKRMPRLTHQQSNVIADFLNTGKNLVIFPEGTSTDGTHLLPFKSSLLQSVFSVPHEGIHIQPIAISCAHMGGKASLYPWYGDMTLASHIWKIFQESGYEITLHFLPALPASQFDDRKALADYAYRQIKSVEFGTN
jgi:1-acyl-sn-glycerol-3-phosphate acyltransferase